MEAHNGLSAKIVEEAGFPGIWASGLTISTALGVRDRNEASWTQVLDILEFMSDATSVPILLDGDTGYGDFNNFRRLVRKLEQRAVAAVCIEDKIFPKTNSFIDTEQPLADIDEFCGKIKAGKDSQRDDAFSIIARVEALIAGRGMAEALKRAAAYHAAGADGILIHSKKSEAGEILEFVKEWSDRAPLVIVPTKYYATPTQVFRDAGISLVIWANHNLRAALTAMRGVTRQIYEQQSLIDVEDGVASLGDVFGIVGNDEMLDAEKRYLPVPSTPARAIVLAASRGNRLARLTQDRPKCMLDLRGEPLLRRLVRSLKSAGIQNVTVVAGYKPETIDLDGIRKVINENYASTGELASLATALDDLEGDCLITYGDILVRDFIVTQMMRSPRDITIMVDAGTPSKNADKGTTYDYVSCSAPFTDDPLDVMPVTLRQISKTIDPVEASGEWIGMVRFSERGSQAVRAELEAMREDGILDQASMLDLLTRLIERGMPIHVDYVAGHWLNVNDAFDLASARNFL
mgnify:CR=1 FL=1